MALWDLHSAGACIPHGPAYHTRLHDSRAGNA
ncbi:hypothetical protein E2C01_098892 [Portunus trituberculatus]|uniref:Uncharacterized protein n=1 Tax=Portunus trituberculatus TaxID=210409 RepID=A0A5B7K9E2_PORTR|nr:hypothetical protein [Portunus trituberculatus]